MPAMPTIEQLVKSIDGRLQELRGEIASLEAARSGRTPALKAAASPGGSPRG
jgi:hypothetical protein